MKHALTRLRVASLGAVNLELKTADDVLPRSGVNKAGAKVSPAAPVTEL